jgi:lactate dehydrogenase-like 2-hydroxyacid dehydrogenase
MALPGVRLELLASCSSHFPTSALPQFCNSKGASPFRSNRNLLAHCRGEVYGNPLVLSSGNRNDWDSCGVHRDWRRLQVSAIDAAQEFDFESKKLTELMRKNKLRVGIVGFGNFGQFLARRFVKQGHEVLAYSRSNYGDIAKEIGVTYYRYIRLTFARV